MRFLLASLALALQVGNSPAPLGVRPIIDTDRVRVWDLTWTRLAPGPMHRHEYDAVGVYLTASSVRTMIPNGASAVTPVTPGDVVFWKKGIEHREGGASPTAARVVIIELKEHRVPPLGKRSPYAAAFPRPGSRKVLENEKVVVWDYSWPSGQPTPQHFHDKDALVVYLENGSIRSTTPDGQSLVREVSMGLVQFNLRDRAHTEQLIKGKSRAIITELK